MVEMSSLSLTLCSLVQAHTHLHTAQETVSWRPRPFPRCLEKEVKKENSLGQFRILQRIDFESADFRVGVPAMVI